jgi:hypothetical protein
LPDAANVRVVDPLAPGLLIAIDAGAAATVKDAAPVTTSAVDAVEGE